jgi:hypothetical protein
MVFGEITTRAKVDYEKIVRDTCRNIGFISDDVGLDCDKCKVCAAAEGLSMCLWPRCSPTFLQMTYMRASDTCSPHPLNHPSQILSLVHPPSCCIAMQVLVHIEEQSPDIGQGVHGMGTKTLEEIGAGDQGHMFGYATDETPELMPLTHMLATQLGYKLTEVRKNGVCPWLRPDGKTQVTVEYKKEGGAVVPIRVHTILISTQHSPDVSNDKIKEDLMEYVIKPVSCAQAWGLDGWGQGPYLTACSLCSAASEYLSFVRMAYHPTCPPLPYPAPPLPTHTHIHTHTHTHTHTGCP